MSDSARPHRWQPNRLLRPWDSPGKNTGVGCHFLLQCMKVKSESEVAQSCPTLCNPMDCSLPGSSVHGIFQARALEWGAIDMTTGSLFLNHHCTFDCHHKLVKLSYKEWSLLRSSYFCSENKYTEAVNTVLWITLRTATNAQILMLITVMCAVLSHSVMSDSWLPFRLLPTRLLCLWDFSGKNTRVGCHFLLQEIFPTQGSNLHHCVSLLLVGFYRWAIKEAW